MKKLLLSFALIFASFVGYSQEMMDMGYIADFTQIKANGPFIINLIHGESTKMEAKFNGIDASKLKWGVKNGELSLQMNVGFTQREAVVEFNIHYKNLNKIESEGAKINTKGILKAQSLTLAIGGSVSKANMKLNVTDLEVRASGNTVMKLEGQAEYLAVKGTLGSNVNALFLSAENATVSAGGGSEVYVWAKKRLEARAVSGGVVYYRGKPELLKISKSLGGIVKEVDENQNALPE